MERPLKGLLNSIKEGQGGGPAGFWQPFGAAEHANGVACWVGHLHDYGKELFSRERFEELAAVLGGLKGRFILSLNDVQGVRETFAGFRFHEVRTTYTIAATGAAPERAELLISNYDLKIN